MTTTDEDVEDATEEGHVEAPNESTEEGVIHPAFFGSLLSFLARIRQKCSVKSMMRTATITLTRKNSPESPLT
jgi:hypothetical protein